MLRSVPCPEGQKEAPSDVPAGARHRRNDVSSERRRFLDVRNVSRRPDDQEGLQAGQTPRFPALVNCHSLVKQPQLTSEYSQKADRLHEGGILHQKEHEHGQGGEARAQHTPQ